MSSYLLIDSDSIAYSASCRKKDSREDDGFEMDMDVIVGKIHSSIQFIINGLIDEGVHIDAMKLFIGTKYNFRDIIYSEYKANRRGKPKPTLLNDALEYMSTELHAFSVPFLESDDIVLATKLELEKDWTNNVFIGYIDKDLLQNAGMYYDYFWKRDVRLVEVTEQQALINFWASMLSGDDGDNIKSKKGIGDGKARKILKGVTTTFGARKIVYCKYLEWFGRKGRSKFLLNYRLLKMVTENVPTPETFESPDFYI